MSGEGQESGKGGRIRRPQPRAEVSLPHLIRRVLTVKEFAACIAVSEATVVRMIHAGQVGFIDNPRGGKRIPVEEVEAYLRRNRREFKPGRPAEQGEAAPKAPPSPAATGVAVGGDGRSRLRRRT